MKTFQNTTQRRTIHDFLELIEKSDKDNIIEEEGFFCWGNSIIKHSDGLYYSFLNKWSDVDGYQGWQHYNNIYISDGCVSPLGPYVNYEEIEFENPQSWCEKHRANQKVFWHNNKLHLIFVGSTYETISYPVGASSESRANQRIGLATSNHPKGKWLLEPTNPIFEPRGSGYWDQTLVVNPSIWRDINGLWRMVYKSDYFGDYASLKVGVATSTDLINWTHSDTPNFGNFPLDADVEDADVWQEGDKWYGTIVDIGSTITGNYRWGIFLISNDGINFEIAENQPAWNKTIEWTDGTSDTYSQEERPFVLVENGVGIAFSSILRGGSNNSFNIVRPIKFDL